ncbi:MAG: preQ(1) synthase [Syntrophales bacterium]|jgi:7-cyano-7-deazaguanine reductase|nr:preQ(1) synthase [Syntrophales bacterium]NLN61221.1 NADPH-dependent 7-cyano-7-deazaguanine reductase QueF [Deltaproteobacteria bacterium]
MEKKTQTSDLEGLTLLGSKATAVRKLETFPNHHPTRDYMVTMESEEFTTLCPLTGQPDFAKIKISYIPDKKILESKSLKLYLWSFRDQGFFHEHAANMILDDVVAALGPRYCRITAVFAVRGGISIAIDAEYKQ